MGWIEKLFLLVRTKPISHYPEDQDGMSKLSSISGLLHSFDRIAAWIQRVVFATLCLASIPSMVLATQPIEIHSMVQTYRHADLGIIGDAVFCTTRVIQRRDSVSTGGWVRHYTTSTEICTVRVDTVFKGCYLDSVIVIQSKSRVQAESRETRFPKVDEKGDSIFEALEFVEYGGEETGRIHRGNKYIMLIREDDASYICTYAHPYELGSGKISGRVEDRETGESLRLALVIINPTGMWAWSNEDGYYEILGVPPGTYDVEVWMMGYRNGPQTDVRVLGDSTATVDFSLRISVIELQE